MVSKVPVRPARACEQGADLAVGQGLGGRLGAAHRDPSECGKGATLSTYKRDVPDQSGTAGRTLRSRRRARRSSAGRQETHRQVEVFKHALCVSDFPRPSVKGADLLNVRRIICRRLDPCARNRIEGGCNLYVEAVRWLLTLDQPRPRPGCLRPKIHKLATEEGLEWGRLHARRLARGPRARFLVDDRPCVA